MQSEKALSVLGHHPVTLPVDFNFEDIEDVFEVYDYLTPNDARTVLKIREEKGFSTEDFIIRFTQSFRRAPVIPEDVEMRESETFAIYPGANLFLISDEVRKGQAGLYTAVNGRKPFLNAWDKAADWDVRMRRNDPNNLDLNAVSVSTEETDTMTGQQGHPRALVHEDLGLINSPQGEAAPITERRPPPEIGLCVPVLSEGDEVRKGPDRQCAVQSKDEAAPYNLRNRPAPYDLPMRKPGLQGLGYQMIKSCKKRGSERLKIPPLAMSFEPGSTQVAQTSGQQQSLPSSNSKQADDGELSSPMDEDILLAVTPSVSEMETKEAVSNGSLVVGGEDGHIYIVRHSSMEVAERYVVRYLQILQERATSDS